MATRAAVPLGKASQHGDAGWSGERREQLATDVNDLQAVDGPTNEAKSDQGPATWLPPAAGYDCLYVTRFACVLSTYELTIDDADRAAIDHTLGSCSWPTGGSGDGDVLDRAPGDRGAAARGRRGRSADRVVDAPWLLARVLAFGGAARVVALYLAAVWWVLSPLVVVLQVVLVTCPWTRYYLSPRARRRARAVRDPHRVAHR